MKYALQYLPSGDDPLDFSHYCGGSPDPSHHGELSENEDDYYTVDFIKAKRLQDSGSIQYLVRYSGFTSEHDEWLDESDLAFCKDKVQQFNDSN